MEILPPGSPSGSPSGKMCDSVSQMSCLVIKNIGDITAEEIRDLFSLPGETSRVEVSDIENENQATLSVPESLVPEVVKLSGVTFKGRDLVIEIDNMATPTVTGTPEGDNMATSTVTGTPEGDATETTDGSAGGMGEEEGEILFMVLDVRNHPDLNFPLVNETEVCDALLQKHANDPHLAVKAGWGSRLGTFVVESTEMGAYVGSTLDIRGHEIPLKPVRRKENTRPTTNHANSRRNDFDPDAVKVRIFDAYEIRYRSIPSEDFDQVFLDMGCDVVKPTLPERCRERRELLNTNRYVIVKPLDSSGSKIDMGGHISVGNRRFKISYPGKQHFCSLCQKKHGRECAKRVRFDALRALRKGLTSEKKIYSDSTLRLANQLALSTDVSCMSGGGIGQICNLIPHDSDHHQEVIINAGTNELKTDCPKEFVYEVDRAVHKLEELATSGPVTLVLPPARCDTPENAGKSQFLRETLSRVPSINVVALSEVEMDETDHPTEKGTLAIIDQINASKKIILDNCRNDVTLPVKYRQVQSVFKAGCRGCENLDYTSSLCAACKQCADSADTSVLFEMIEKHRSQFYPPIDVEMESAKDANKRPAEDSNDDPASKVVKTD